MPFRIAVILLLTFGSSLSYLGRPKRGCCDGLQSTPRYAGYDVGEEPQIEQPDENHKGPHNVVIWDRNPCFDKYKNMTGKDICGEGAQQLIGEKLNFERYIGIGCQCDQYTLESDGFSCNIPCDRKIHVNVLRECRKKKMYCFLDRKTREPSCKCGVGTMEVGSGSNRRCKKMDPCKMCRHRCHKASKCMPASADSIYGYSCKPCDKSKGYTGNGIQCIDIDECADDRLNQCDIPNAECENFEPIYDNNLKYTCKCKEGWQGDPKGGYKWRKCKDTNECLNSTACGKNTICVNTPGCYVCECKKGYQKKLNDVKSCVDINECKDSNPCHIKAKCINTPGSYNCECVKGYFGDGKMDCKPDKEYWCKRCDRLTTTCKLNRVGDAYKCACKKGFEPISGRTDSCKEINYCADPFLNNCDKTPGYAKCIGLRGGYKCECNNGYEGDGKICKPMDPCLLENKCYQIAGVVCVNKNGKAVCQCKKGFVRPQKHRFNESAPCFDISSAPVNNCSICNNMTSKCQRIGNGPFYECICREGYEMNNALGSCENTNECKHRVDNDCDQNADCEDKEPAIHGMRYKCTCKPGYKGKGTMDQCRDVNECREVSNACPLPNQECRNTIGSYECRCGKGFKQVQGSKMCANINECLEGTAECPIMSKCRDTVGGYTCECMTGFRTMKFNATYHCGNVDECKEGVGPNHEPACDPVNGRCVDTFGSFICNCKSGFKKGIDMRSCIDKDECKDGEDRCNKQIEICVNTIGNYTCECKYGMVKVRGSCVDRNECKDGSNKCLKNSVCINTFASYRCVCEPGFKAKLGSVPLRPLCEREDVCVKFPTICMPGQCESSEKEPYYKCICPSSSVELNSTKCINPNYCDKNFPCPRHSRCVNGQCICANGFRWQETSDFPLTLESLRNRPPCKGINPCNEGEQCKAPLKCLQVGPGKHTCICNSGFEFDGKTCLDIDECNLQVGAVRCPKNTKCTNLVGSYKCECENGFTASVGSSLTHPHCLDVDECEAGLDNCASKNAKCVNKVGRYTCECAEGYAKQAPDYKRCKDVDECITGKAKCDSHATCVNYDGTYACKCNKGYNGDGETCFDIDECDPADRRDNCNHRTQECVNTDGSFNCTCKKGYELTPTGCNDINECLSSDNNDCNKKGGIVPMKCINEPGGYMCVCPKGYHGPTMDNQCEDIDECKAVPPPCPTSEEYRCVNKKGSFSCECNDGYKKPKHCIKKAKCPCQNINECIAGTRKNGIVRKACGSSAKCTDLPGSYKCECAPGFDGDAYGIGCKLMNACEANPNKCDSETEICRSVGTEAICECKPGYLRQTSKKCVPNPCKIDKGGCGKGARCHPIKVDGKFTVECKCKFGFELDRKKNCNPIDACKCSKRVPKGVACKSPVLCRHPRMLCLNSGSSHICLCEDGFMISNDKKSCRNINECREGVGGVISKRACDRTAKCIDTIGSYICDCPRGQIENNVHECKIDTPKCSREKNCIHDENAYCARIDENHQHCKCKNGFRGLAIPGGPSCEPIDYCKALGPKVNKVCRKNEHCVSGKERYHCICNDGFARETSKGDCEDVDECETGLAQCPPTYECKNTIGSFKCVCPKGYELSRTGKSCVDIDECVNVGGRKRNNCAKPEQRCENIPGSYKCVCNYPAWVEGQGGCVDNDECAENSYECPEFSKCVNKRGGYDCECYAGFKPRKNSKRKVQKCDDINECVEDKEACPPNAKCINHIGSYECKCRPPAIQHGLKDCVVNASCPQTCHPKAYCLKSSRAGGDVYNCTCNVGYTGDGVTSCEGIDECALGIAQCHKMAECIDRNPLYECRCREPYVGDGKNICLPEKVCETRNDCPSEAKCIPLFPQQEEGKWVTCKCPKGFNFNKKTRECDDINECAENNGLGPCSRLIKGIRCINTQGSFFCKCPRGYRNDRTKLNCVDINECLDIGSDICAKTGGKCKNLPGTFICECSKGFQLGSNGKECVDVDECATHKDNCDKRTTECKNTIGSFDCNCKQSGFAHIPGQRNKCEDLNECVEETHNCSSYSELCHNTIGGFKCNCSNGYERKSGICVPNSNCNKQLECGANAFCVMRRSRSDPSKKVPTCVCQNGYYGENPEKFCDPVPDCENDGQCPSNSKCIETQTRNSKGRASFSCLCDRGYRKKKSQCEPINECRENPGVCGPNAKCIDLSPFYKCVCDDGAIESRDGKYMKHTMCKMPTCKDMRHPCHKDARCINLPRGGYTCKCNKGFRGVGTSKLGCDPINFCEDFSPCSQYATCINFPRGHYTCTCKPGYIGNGTICHDFNECKDSNHPPCDTKAKCYNTQGSYFCKCLKGYEGEGRQGTCKDVDECASPRLNKCDSLSTICRNIDGSFECNCKPGYKPSKNRYICNDINECLNERKVCGIHNCNNLPGDYTCACLPGYKLTFDGHKCQDINECTGRPCHINADCINTAGSYLCSCRTGYEGDGKEKCEITDKCKSPKNNRCDPVTTKCVMVPFRSDYRCECRRGFQPPQHVAGVYYYCEDIDECATGLAVFNPRTQNCLNVIGSYKLFCKVGCVEKDGECVDLDECAEDPAYQETLKKYNESGSNIKNWYEIMVEPRNKSSAYAICYERAKSKQWWWFTSASSPLPFCRNTIYEPRGGFNGNPKVQSWKGFECDCAPGQKRYEPNGRSSNRIIIKCNEIDPCESLRCTDLGEGWICDRAKKLCVCDASAGYIQRINRFAFCTKDECTTVDTHGPLTVKNIEQRLMISCDPVNKRWMAVKGYTFMRDTHTNAIMGLQDINECLDENYCCDRKKAMCHLYKDKCKVTCYNYDGGAACYCNANDPDVGIDRDNCLCISKCAVNSAWYLQCNNDHVICSRSVWIKLLAAPTVPKGTVCSRLSTSDGKYLDFASMKELVAELCRTNAFCAMPPHVIDDIRKLPAFNYEGPCRKSRKQLENVKCPFGDKPIVLEGIAMPYAYCPFKIDMSKYPGADPIYKKHKGTPMPLQCLPYGQTLDERITFYRSDDNSFYTVEAA